MSGRASRRARDGAEAEAPEFRGALPEVAYCIRDLVLERRTARSAPFVAVKGGRQIQWRRCETRCSSKNTAVIGGSSVAMSGVAARWKAITSRVSLSSPIPAAADRGW